MIIITSAVIKNGVIAFVDLIYDKLAESSDEDLLSKDLTSLSFVTVATDPCSLTESTDNNSAGCSTSSFNQPTTSSVRVVSLLDKLKHSSTSEIVRERQIKFNKPPLGK